MTKTLFPDLAPPQAPKSDRTRYIRRVQAAIIQIGLRATRWTRTTCTGL
jgi:hypothetical protein